LGNITGYGDDLVDNNRNNNSIYKRKEEREIYDGQLYSRIHLIELLYHASTDGYTLVPPMKF